MHCARERSPWIKSEDWNSDWLSYIVNTHGVHALHGLATFGSSTLLTDITWHRKCVRAKQKDGRTNAHLQRVSAIVQHITDSVSSSSSSISRRLTDCGDWPPLSLYTRAVPAPINIPLTLCWLLVGARPAVRLDATIHQQPGVTGCVAANPHLLRVMRKSERWRKCMLNEWNRS